MKLTKNILREKYKVFNPHNLCTTTKTLLYIGYTPADTGRAGHSQEWTVVSPTKPTDPDGPWYNYGQKTFLVWNRADKPVKLREAMDWVEKQYGIIDWEKSPFGSYHPKGTMQKLQEEIL